MDRILLLLEVRSVQEMNVKKKLEKIFKQFDYRHYLAGCLTILVVTGIGLSMINNSKIGKVSQNLSNNQSNNNQNLTKYQRVFVDCPAKYIETCTKMSRQRTEKISFIREENNKVRLQMEKNRIMVVKVEDNQSKSTVIRVEDQK